MAERWLLLREARVAAVNSWLANHPQLDLRGGGLQSFNVRLNLNADPPSTVRARLCRWDMPDAWEQAVRDEITSRGWLVNTTNATNDLSSYNVESWTLAQVLADTTRKPAVLKLIPEAP